MNAPSDIISQDNQDLVLSGKKLVNPRAFESRLSRPIIKDTSFNGLLVEQCFVHALAAVGVRARNTIIGPNTTITWSLLEDVKIKFLQLLKYIML